MREFMAKGCLIALALAFLVHLALISWYGEIVISEANPFILWGEVLLILGLITFGISNIFKIVR